MKRKLARQILNEWRANLWLAIELLLVSIIVWFISDYLYSVIATVSEPTGFDISHTYHITVGRTGADSDRHVDYGDDAAARNAADMAKLFEALRSHNDIEAVSASSYAEPYKLNYYGSSWHRDTDSVSVNVRLMCATPGHLDVFDYQPADPSVSKEDLKEAMRAGKAIITDFPAGFHAVSDKNICAKDLVGSRMTDNGTTYEIGGVVQYIKRRDTEPALLDVGAIMPLDENIPEHLSSCSSLSIRVKPESDKNFLDRFNAERDRRFRFGNTYISDIKPYSSLKRTACHEKAVTTRKFVACMAFMLVSVFLGLFGTFWFRSRMRTGEIALRKINGATNGNIFRRIVSEGLLLLTAVTPVAVAADWIICRHDLNMSIFDTGYSPARFGVSVAATYIILTLTIVLGTMYPALKAMHTDPACALKDE